MPPASPPKDRRTRVISYRVTDAVAQSLQDLVSNQVDPSLNTVEKMARNLLLTSVALNPDNRIYKAAKSNTSFTTQVVAGDACSTLKQVETSVIDCIVTSPPYFGQRTYGGGDLEIGREKSPELYVSRLRDVFRECQRVLRPTGTLWVNIDDSFHKKDMLGLPWRLMWALQADGWCVRSESIWNKKRHAGRRD